MSKNFFISLQTPTKQKKKISSFFHFIFILPKFTQSSGKYCIIPADEAKYVGLHVGKIFASTLGGVFLIFLKCSVFLVN